MSVSVITLNIEGDRHFDRFIPVVKRINPDVVCLQEVFEVDLAQIAAGLGFASSEYHFMPMTTIDAENKYNISPKGPWGVAMLTHLDHAPFQTLYYKGQGTTPSFSTPNSVDRGMLFATIVSSTAEKVLLGTTHFTWTGDGNTSAQQQADFQSLRHVVSELPPHVLCGDFNSPRGGKTFELFEEIYTDAVPKEVTTTIDGSLHYAGELELVVDTAFYQEPLQVEVQEVIAGVSDHKAIHFLVQAA